MLANPDLLVSWVHLLWSMTRNSSWCADLNPICLFIYWIDNRDNFIKDGNYKILPVYAGHFLFQLPFCGLDSVAQRKVLTCATLRLCVWVMLPIKKTAILVASDWEWSRWSKFSLYAPTKVSLLFRWFDCLGACHVTCVQWMGCHLLQSSVLLKMWLHLIHSIIFLGRHP